MVQAWSFASLLQRARQLARRLSHIQAPAGCVGLGLDEGIPMLLLHVAVLEVGILKLGTLWFHQSHGWKIPQLSVEGGILDNHKITDKWS